MGAKNSLIQRASRETHGWSDLGELATLESGVLVVEESIGDAITAYEKFETKLKKSGRKEIFPHRGGVLDGNLLTPHDVLKLKTLPTKEEAMAKIAIALKGTPRLFALAMKNVPTKLARVISEVSKQKQ